MTDQQRGDSAPPYGRAITPNLDRLRAEGVSFSKTFCTAPHCCPSRASFFSGLYPSEHGVWNNVDVGNALSRGFFDGVRLFSEDLKEAGYSLHYSGKWHVSAVETPEQRGWGTTMHYQPSHSGASLNKPVVHEWERYKRHIHESSSSSRRREGEIQRPGYGNVVLYCVDENPFGDRAVINDALQAIRKRGHSDQPWCQMIAPLGPHDPYLVPEKFLNLYSIDDIELPANFNDRMEDKPALYRRTRSRFDQLSELEHRQAIRHYLAFCSYEDALFGEILQAIEDAGERDNTLVLYLSDHGDYAAEHGLWCKGLPAFQSAYHIPAIVRFPGCIVRPGRDVDAFVSITDFAPTFLELAGIQSRRNFAGKSLVPFFEDTKPSNPWRDAIFTQSNGNELYGIQRSVMTAEWKYVYNGFDFDELYHISQDPGEAVNLINDLSYSGIVKEMCGRLWRFAYEHQDACINSYIMVGLAPWGPGEAFSEDQPFRENA